MFSHIVLRLRGGTDDEHAAKIDELEGRIKHFINQLNDISDRKSWDAFFIVIHKPPFTSVAELAFASGAAENLVSMAAVMKKAKQNLIESSLLVEGESTSS